MSEHLAFWIVILCLAAGTFLLRSIPIWVHGKVPMPSWVERLLRYVPPAALAALVVPSSVYLVEDGSYTLAPARILAALAALAIAWRSKNVTATLAVGMAALWTLQIVIPA